MGARGADEPQTAVPGLAVCMPISEQAGGGEGWQSAALALCAPLSLAVLWYTCLCATATNLER